MFVFKLNAAMDPQYIINFPTKRHWKGKSRIEDIESGLKALIQEVERHKIKSIAIPALGSGLGGLDWNHVRPMIERAFEGLSGHVRVLLYGPQVPPDSRDMLVRTTKPRMTSARALFIKLMAQYSELDYSKTLLEIQKIAYFLQEAGEKLNLRFEKHKYGPYAPNLDKALEVLEGHYIRGLGDSQNPYSEIDLLPDAVETATLFLEDQKESLERLDRVGNLIRGFETPYSMELIASVHWLATHEEPKAKNSDEAIRLMHQWSSRKESRFPDRHIHIAWGRLQEEGWLPGREA